MGLIRCKNCGAVISFRGTKFGERVPKDVKLKPVYKDGIEKRLCSDCQDKVK